MSGDGDELMRRILRRQKAQEFESMDVDAIARMSDAELAKARNSAIAGTPQYVAFEQEWEMRLAKVQAEATARSAKSTNRTAVILALLAIGVTIVIAVLQSLPRQTQNQIGPAGGDTSHAAPVQHRPYRPVPPTAHQPDSRRTAPQVSTSQ